MKKIGILYGMEQTFPPAVIDYINTIRPRGILAELVKIGAVTIEDLFKYNVILDRVSYEVPFYQSVLKHAALNGNIVVNNPFLSCSDDNFFLTAMAFKKGISVPKTAIIPSKMHPPGTTSETLRNLIYPLDWDSLFDYIGFPANLKTNKGNGVYHSYRVYNRNEFFSAFDLTGDKVMLLQQHIDYDDYYRCYVIGKKHVRIMKYDPSKPQHLRYSPEMPTASSKVLADMINTCLTVCNSLGTDFNVIEFGIYDNKIYAVDLLNPLPSAERAYLLEDNFNWLVKTTSEFLIELASASKHSIRDYSLSEFMRPAEIKDTAKKRKRGKPRKKVILTTNKRKSKIDSVREYPGKEL